MNKAMMFNRKGDPLSKMGIGRGQYLYSDGDMFYDNKNEVTYLRTHPKDPNGKYDYRAVIYKDPEYDDQWVLRIEQYFYKGISGKKGWSITPGSWFLSTLLGEPNKYEIKNVRRGDVFSIQGNDWMVQNMILVLEEAEIIRNTIELNKDKIMNESVKFFLNEQSEDLSKYYVEIMRALENSNIPEEEINNLVMNYSQIINQNFNNGESPESCVEDLIEISLEDEGGKDPVGGPHYGYENDPTAIYEDLRKELEISDIKGWLADRID